MSEKKRKTNSKNNKELNKAIDEIPGLILEEMGRKYEQEHREETHKEPILKKSQKTNAQIYQPPHRSKTWLWVGVTLFTVCIIVLWGLNISTMFYENGTKGDPILDQLKQSQQDFGTIMRTFGEDETPIQTATTTQEVVGEKEENNLETKLKNAMNSLFTTSSVTNTRISTSTE
ncbi:MAG: hypothetical protein HYV41_04355 [Candidatus Magasanikbacteria bacterium]|nr:hypothetical protein [Candidatus Magasanikbacteria bacterium]